MKQLLKKSVALLVAMWLIVMWLLGMMVLLVVSADGPIDINVKNIWVLYGFTLGVPVVSLAILKWANRK